MNAPQNKNTKGSLKFFSKITLASLALLALVSACNSQGNLEKAGEKADKVIEDAGEAVEDAGDKVEKETSR